MQEDDETGANTKRPADSGSSSSSSRSTRTKPRQVFWEKRLSGLRATYPGEQEYQPITLPDGFKPVGPGVGSDAALTSISTSLHMMSGQAKEKDPKEKEGKDKDASASAADGKEGTTEIKGQKDSKV